VNTISIILPTYNEAENIIFLIESLQLHVSGLKEVIVVDDDSPDGTAALVQDWIKKHGNRQVRLILRTSNRGLTNSINEGIQKASGDIIVWMDADFSMPPEDINTLTTAVVHGADIAVGSRFVTGGKTKQRGDPRDQWYAIAASEFGNKMMLYLFGLNFHDYTSGFVAVRKHILQSLPLHGDYGEYFIDFIVRAFAHGYRIIEIPYICKPRLHGVSKTATSLPTLFRRCYQYATVVMKLLWETKIKKNNL